MKLSRKHQPRVSIRDISSYIASVVDRDISIPSTKQYRATASLAGFEMTLPNGQVFQIEVREI